MDNITYLAIVLSYSQLKLVQVLTLRNLKNFSRVSNKYFYERMELFTSMKGWSYSLMESDSVAMGVDFDIPL